MSKFTVAEPNKWLAHMAKKYPDDAAGFNDVSNYIDNLRHACGEAKNYLDQIIGTARQGIVKSEEIWSPMLTEADLKKMMNDPRYWRDHEPDYVAQIRKGFETLYPDTSKSDQQAAAYPCYKEGCNNPATVLRSSGNWCNEHEPSSDTLLRDSATTAENSHSQNPDINPVSVTDGDLDNTDT